jgi:hypothetical protein
MKKCQFCAEDIQDAAIKCRYCGTMLDEAAQSAASTGKPVIAADVELRNLHIEEATATHTPTRKRCPSCAEEIQDEAAVCHHCGREFNTATAVTTAGIGESLFMGFALMCVCFTVGGCLTMTGIGAIVGIPVILAGLFLLFVKPFIPSLRLKKGLCPYCRHGISIDGAAGTCRTCKKRIVVRGKQFTRVEDGLPARPIAANL